jgi:hypothetical protein
VPETFEQQEDDGLVPASGVRPAMLIYGVHALPVIW